jgi:Ulp1 family protease
MKLLEPNEFLNDNIIEFYMKYIQLSILNNEDRDKYHFFNSFLYKSYGGKGGYEKVKKWTKNVDIFSKKYVFVPINEKYFTVTIYY